MDVRKPEDLTWRPDHDKELATHRYTGSLIPAAFLLLVWTGTWWARSILQWSVSSESSEKVALGSNT